MELLQSFFKPQDNGIFMVVPGYKDGEPFPLNRGPEKVLSNLRMRKKDTTGAYTFRVRRGKVGNKKIIS